MCVGTCTPILGRSARRCAFPRRRRDSGAASRVEGKEWGEEGGGRKATAWGWGRDTEPRASRLPLSSRPASSRATMSEGETSLGAPPDRGVGAAGLHFLVGLLLLLLLVGAGAGARVALRGRGRAVGRRSRDPPERCPDPRLLASEGVSRQGFGPARGSCSLNSLKNAFNEKTGDGLCVPSSLLSGAYFCALGGGRMGRREGDARQRGSEIARQLTGRLTIRQGLFCDKHRLISGCSAASHRRRRNFSPGALHPRGVSRYLSCRY